TRVISPNSVLEVKFGYNEPYVPGITHVPGLTRADFLNSTGIHLFQEDTPFDTTPNFNVTGQFSTSGSGVATDDHVYQWMGTYSKQLARHNLRAGGGYSRRQYFYNGSTPMHGTATFDTRLTELATQSNSGHSTASFLLGYPSQIDRGLGDASTNGRQNATYFFIQDDWHVNTQLTINYGVRYEIANPPYDTTDRVGTLWLQRDPQSGKYSGELLWGTVNPLPDPVTGAVDQPARRGAFGRSLQANCYRNLAPRVGLAYQLSPRMTLRTGFGIYYNSTFMQELQDKRKFYPYNISQTFVANTGVLPDLSISDTGPSYTNTTAIGGWAQRPDNRTPYSMQWNLFLARELGFSTVLEAGYVGSGNRKQIGYAPFNVALTPGPGAVQPRRLLPEYGDFNWGANLFNSNYNALQVKVQRRFSRGLQLQANYTWSRSMDEQSSLAETKTQNPFDRRADYSRSSWDLRHVFQLAYVWELPVGRGRRFGANWPIAMDLFLGGWAFEGITRYQTGGPVNVVLGQDRANVGSTTQRPDLIRDPNTGPRTPEQWFDTGAFQMPAPYTYGSAGAFVVNSDGRHNWDVSVAKWFRIHESHSLEVRAEMFNISNSVSMGDPNAQFTSSAFGQVTSATAARQIQLALRYTF
ncbi:MAG TPA: TonB-dependent receptor, partial [Bryobacteraceae bacterium]|nr:TonB-dependent receptor [Bryobacteraceae bacterium]